MVVFNRITGIVGQVYLTVVITEEPDPLLLVWVLSDDLGGKTKPRGEVPLRIQIGAKDD